MTSGVETEAAVTSDRVTEDATDRSRTTPQHLILTHGPTGLVSPAARLPKQPPTTPRTQPAALREVAGTGAC